MSLPRQTRRKPQKQLIPQDSLSKVGLESETKESNPKDLIARLKEELKTLYRSREKDLVFDRQNLERIRCMTSVLLLYANPNSWIYRLPDPSGYARAALIDLGILLPEKSKEPEAQLEPETRGHKGVPGILGESEAEEIGFGIQVGVEGE